RQLEAAAVVEGDLERLAVAMDDDVGGRRGVFVESGHGVGPLAGGPIIPESPASRSDAGAGARRVCTRAGGPARSAQARSSKSRDNRSSKADPSSSASRSVTARR